MHIGLEATLRNNLKTQDSVWMMFEIAVITVFLAFMFTFTNGFQDASTMAATFIASRSASPRNGIVMVAFMSFLGAILGGSAVAFTLSGLITIDSGVQTVLVLLAALVGATIWNLIAWKYALPSSSTHALIGGLIGAGVVSAGLGGVFWGIEELIQPPHQLEGLMKVLFFLLISVIIGFLGSFLMRNITRFLLRNAKRSINKGIIRLNWFTAAAMSFANGANDSQKQLGVIVLVLLSTGQLSTMDVPFWARAGCAILLAAGTLGGGWRIMNTLGNRIFKLAPIHSFDSQVSSGVSIAVSTLAGAPVSSTHIVSTSVLGVGTAENLRKVQWLVGRDIIIAMIVTIPVTIMMSGVIYMIISLILGV